MNYIILYFVYYVKYLPVYTRSNRMGKMCIITWFRTILILNLTAVTRNFFISSLFSYLTERHPSGEYEEIPDSPESKVSFLIIQSINIYQIYILSSHSLSCVKHIIRLEVLDFWLLKYSWWIKTFIISIIYLKTG